MRLYFLDIYDRVEFVSDINYEMNHRVCFRTLDSKVNLSFGRSVLWPSEVGHPVLFGVQCEYTSIYCRSVGRYDLTARR